MTKTLFCVCFSFIISFLFIDLSDAQRRSVVGIKGGLNISSFNNSDRDVSSDTGFNLGATADFNFKSLPFLIESGIYFSQKGGIIDRPQTRGTISLDYFEVPVMIKNHLTKVADQNIHAIIGPVLSIKTKSSIRIRFKDDASEVEIDEIFTNISDFTRDIDFGLIVGIGTDFIFAESLLDVQLKYNAGFRNVFGTNTGGNIGNEKNSVFSIVFGLKL